MERRLRPADWVRYDWQIHGAILRNYLVEPDLGITVGVPARRHVLRAARWGDENTVDAKCLAVARGLDLFVCRVRPGARQDRQLAPCLLHRDLEHAPLLLPSEIEDLARFRIDAEPAT